MRATPQRWHIRHLIGPLMVRICAAKPNEGPNSSFHCTFDQFFLWSSFVHGSAPVILMSEDTWVKTWLILEGSFYPLCKNILNMIIRIGEETTSWKLFFLQVFKHAELTTISPNCPAQRNDIFIVTGVRRIKQHYNLENSISLLSRILTLT